MLNRIFALLFALVCPLAAQEHRFFDAPNIVMFTGVAAVRAADLDSTWKFRSQGWDEYVLTNRFVDNKPAFTAFSIGMVGASIAGSYLFHRLKWHSAERALSVVHIVMVGRAVKTNYALLR